MRKHRLAGLLMGSIVLALFAWGASPAMAVDSVTQMTASEAAAYQDPRDDMADRPGTYWKAIYGPYNIPAAGGGSPGTHQAFHLNLPRPACAPNCRITDMIPDLVQADAGGNPTSTTANLSSGLYLHHFVFYQPGVQDKTCPSGPPGSFGERFAGSGNERTHFHLPTGYGYPLSANTWSENVHFLNFNTTSKNVYVQAIIRTEPNTATQPVFPLWLDVDGCSSSGVPGDPITGNSEYPIPTGYSEQHQNWTSTVTGRIIGIYGHQHDLDYQTNATCRANHCPGPSGEAGGIQVSAEILGGPSSTYYGPTSVNHVKPPDLTGATMCRSEDKYGTSYGAANGFNGHLDTMTGCGMTRDVPDGAKPEPYPAGGEFPNTGFPITAGQTIRLHGEYQNDSGAQINDAMSIMQAYYAPRAQTVAEAMRVSLVPAFRQTISSSQCTSRSGLNSSHGAPLAFASCQPPAFIPGTIAHVGPQSTGYAEMAVLPSDPAVGDQADVVFQAITTDIRSGSATGVDYDPSAADATLVAKWRISDDNNTCPAGACRATVADFDMNVPVNCAATADATIGSTCQVDTTADSLNAGSIVEGKAMSVQAFRVRLNDSGTNGTRGDADDRIFEQQGIYIP